MKTRAGIFSRVKDAIFNSSDIDALLSEAYQIGCADGARDAFEQNNKSELAEFGRVLDGKPALSRFLPRRPDDVPAPPDGVVYVLPRAHGGFPRTCHIWGYSSNWAVQEWTCGWSGFRCSDDFHVGISRTAPTDIWHRFGLLSPDEGGGWIPHTPGDPMPCAGDSFVEVLISTGHIGPSLQASERLWDKGKGSNTIGWRPPLVRLRNSSVMKLSLTPPPSPTRPVAGMVDQNSYGEKE